MPYIKTIDELSDTEFVELIGKVKEALGECDRLTEDNGIFTQEVFSCSYNDRISDKNMNELFEEYASKDVDKDVYPHFAYYVDDKLKESYDILADYENVFDEMYGFLDGETQIMLDVSERLGQLDKQGILEQAGYEGIVVDTKSFLEEDYRFDIDVEVDTRNIEERFAQYSPDMAESRNPDDLLMYTLQQASPEEREAIFSAYKQEENEEREDDSICFCVETDRNNVLDTLDSIAKGEGNLEIEGGKIMFDDIRPTIDMKDKFELPLSSIDSNEVCVRDYYYDEFYGEGKTISEEAVYQKAFEEAVKAVNGGSLEAELFFDYHDKYEESQIAEMYHDYNNGDQKLSFSEYFSEKAHEAITDMLLDTINDISDKAEAYLEANDKEAYDYLKENGYRMAISDVLVPAYDIYELVPECRLNIMIATEKEINVENNGISALSEAMYNAYISEETKDTILDNGLVYLLNQQGHTAEELLSPTDDYMEKCKRDFDEVNSDYNYTATLLVQESGKELLDLLDIPRNCKSVEAEAGTNVYLHDENYGRTEEFQPLQTPVVIPASMIYEIQVEGGKQRDRDYTVDNVCGLSKSEWDSGAKFTDRKPEPIQQDLVEFLEAVKDFHEKEAVNDLNEALKDLKEELADIDNEQEGIDLD